MKVTTVKQLAFIPNGNGALFSPCRRYRYELWRTWDTNKPSIMFIGLNPSRGGETYNDPTIKRVIGFANSWGFGTVYMCNLFAFVTPYPDALITCSDPVQNNDFCLQQVARQVAKIVFCWGAFYVFGRDKIVIEMFPDAYCLGKTKSGAPKHPLYVPANTQLIKF